MHRLIEYVFFMWKIQLIMLTIRVSLAGTLSIRDKNWTNYIPTEKQHSNINTSKEPKRTISSSNDNSSFPNIIFILADDLGYGDVSYNGGTARTPNIDAMASGPHSITFSHFYSGSPVCSPTRGTLLTGRNHNRYCIWKANTAGRNCDVHQDFLCPAQHPLPPSEITIAEILKEQGYRTGAFGKWHLGDLKHLPHGHPLWSPSSPGQNGFDDWKVTERSVPTATPNCGCFDTSQCVLGHYKKFGPPPCTNYHMPIDFNNSGEIASHNELINKDDSEFIVDEFSAFLNNSQSHSHKKPFFAYIPFHAVHKKFVAFPPYSEQYQMKRCSVKEVDYYSTITAMDMAVGRIRELLKHHNISSNTMIWFSSDNGPENRTPGRTSGLRGRKGTLYEGGIRVPGIIEWPEMIRNSKITDYPVVTNDFLPTVCDILGIDLPSGRELDGISILPFLKGEVEHRNSTIHWAFGIKGDFNRKYTAAALRSHFKLFVEYKRGRVTNSALYDLSVDSSEEIDVSSEHPDLFKSLLSDLESWRLSVKNSAENEVKCLAT